MKLFTLRKDEYYDGCALLGVYDSLDKLQAVVKDRGGAPATMSDYTWEDGPNMEGYFYEIVTLNEKIEDYH